jgi:hypothetical protein
LPIGKPLTFTVCRGSACISGPFTVEQDDASVSAHAGFRIPAGSLDGVQSDMAEIQISQRESWAAIDVAYVQLDQSKLADGDQYVVTITNAINELLLRKEATVTYTKYYPNGPECDLQPCVQADVTL